MRKIIYVSFFFFLLSDALYPADSRAQRITVPVSLGFDTWFDNREYKSELTPDQTLFGLKATPQIGIGWNEEHSIMAGTDIWADFGGHDAKRRSELILYYKYSGERFEAYAGVFPKRSALGDYPAVIFSDSLSYYDSNFEGALFRYHGMRGYVELGCDWKGMIGERERERFQLFSSGKLLIGSGAFNIGYYLSVFHYSHSYSETGVVDNVIMYPYAGVDIGYFLGQRAFQVFNLRVGWIEAYQNDRRFDSKAHYHGGFQAELRLQKWGVGIYNTLYAGMNLMPFYDRYGTGVYTGEAFYRTENDIYNRLEVYWNAVDRREMKLKVGSVHHYDGRKWGWQQRLTFSIMLDKETLR